MHVLLCWGSCSETSCSWEHFQLILIKQRLAAQVLRSISSEIFEPCLWLVAPNSNHLESGWSSPLSAKHAGCSHTMQPGKHSLQPGHQTSLPASGTVSHSVCSHTAVPMYIFATLCFHTLEMNIAAESCSSETLCTHRLLNYHANNFLATNFHMQIFFNYSYT